MISTRILAEEQYRLIMECRQRVFTDHQWCVDPTIFIQRHGPGTMQKVILMLFRIS